MATMHTLSEIKKVIPAAGDSDWDWETDNVYENQVNIEELDFHEECRKLCRSAIISLYVELYPESLSRADDQESLPLHRLLWKEFSSIDDALMMIEKYPVAVRRSDKYECVSLHIECMNQCRSSIVWKCIELYPEALSMADEKGFLPLHMLLWNESSAIEIALMVIEEYPAALQHQIHFGELPLHLECFCQCRSSIISKCIELYPETLDDQVIKIIIRKVSRANFNRYASVLSIIFTARPMSLYDHDAYVDNDIRDDPHYRRRILNLLPIDVFTSSHDADYRDLNWQPRTTMILLLSQIKIQQKSM
jgi:hypothetical protein